MWYDEAEKIVRLKECHDADNVDQRRCVDVHVGLQVVERRRLMLVLILHG